MHRQRFRDSQRASTKPSAEHSSSQATEETTWAQGNNHSNGAKGIISGTYPVPEWKTSQFTEHQVESSEGVASGMGQINPRLKADPFTPNRAWKQASKESNYF